MNTDRKAALAEKFAEWLEGRFHPNYLEDALCGRPAARRQPDQQDETQADAPQ